MRNDRRTALAAAPLSLALLLAGACSDDDPADDDATTTTTTATTTSSEPPATPTTATTAPPSSDTTAPPPSSETTAPPEDESQAGDPLPEGYEEWASELIRAWGAGDRERAAELAQPEVVDTLFGYRDPGGDDWDLEGCEGAAGIFHCTFSSASLAQSIVTEQGAPNNELGPIHRATVIP